jgi:hypothetical protein
MPFASHQVVDVRPVHVGTDLVDIGINLAHKNYSNDFADVLSRAMGARVTQSIITGVTLDSSKSAIALANAHPGVLFATGMRDAPPIRTCACIAVVPTLESHEHSHSLNGHLWPLLSRCVFVWLFGFYCVFLCTPTWARVLLTVGVHPHDAETVLNQDAERSEEVLFQKLCALVDSHRVVSGSSASAAAAAASAPIPCVVAIGECGYVQCVHLSILYVCMYVCMYVCVCIFVCIYVCVDVCVHITVLPRLFRP